MNNDDQNSEKSRFFQALTVTRETYPQMERYANLLLEWNKKFNLIASGSVQNLWTRHFLDSAQLIKFIPESTKILVDLGSGAGFPGLVLAIMGKFEVHLTESVGKKANFLKTMVGELNLSNVTVHQQRIEDIRGLQADVITARALKPLPELLSLAKPLTHKDSICLFLKGQQADAELTAARKYWTFTEEKLPSLSDNSGVILKIKELKILRHHEHKRPQHDSN